MIARFYDRIEDGYDRPGPRTPQDLFDVLDHIHSDLIAADPLTEVEKDNRLAMKLIVETALEQMVENFHEVSL